MIDHLPDEIIEELFRMFSLNELLCWMRSSRRLNNLAVLYLGHNPVKLLNRSNGSWRFLPTQSLLREIQTIPSALSKSIAAGGTCYDACGNRLSGYPNFKVTYIKTVIQPIRSYQWFIGAFRNVETIDLSLWSEMVCDETIEYLARAQRDAADVFNNTRLRILNISNCKNLTAACASSLSQLILGGLEVLIADNIDDAKVLLGPLGPEDSTQDRDFTPSAFGGWIKPRNAVKLRIKVLSLARNNWLDWYLIQHFASSSPRLHTLNLVGCDSSHASCLGGDYKISRTTSPPFDLSKICPQLTVVKMD
jgi:hypothetical protein